MSTQTRLPQSRAVKWPPPPPPGSVRSPRPSGTPGPSAPFSSRRYGRPPTPPRRECISGDLCDCPCGQGWVSSATASPRLRRHSSASRRSSSTVVAAVARRPPSARLPLRIPNSLARARSGLRRRTGPRRVAPAARSSAAPAQHGAGSARTRLVRRRERPPRPPMADLGFQAGPAMHSSPVSPRRPEKCSEFIFL